MTRYILCEKCSGELVLHPDDDQNGFKLRKRYIAHTTKPPEHEIKIIAGGETQVIPVTTVVCDFCNEEVLGQPSWGCTMYQGEEPWNWEEEFGYNQPNHEKEN